METIKAAERELGQVAGSAARIKGRLSKARRALRGNSPDPEKAAGFLAEARERYAEEVAWRTRAADELLPGLSAYDDAIKHNIGLRVQERLTKEQARLIAECKSVHRDVSPVLLTGSVGLSRLENRPPPTGPLRRKPFPTGSVFGAGRRYSPRPSRSSPITNRTPPTPVSRPRQRKRDARQTGLVCEHGIRTRIR